MAWYNQITTAKKLPQRPTPWRPGAQQRLPPQSYSPSAEPVIPVDIGSRYSPPPMRPGAAQSLLDAPGGVGGPTLLPGFPMLQRYTAGLGTAPDIGTSGDRVRQIADLIRGQAGPNEAPQPAAAAPSPAPGGAGVTDVMDALTDHWFGLRKRSGQPTGAMPQPPVAASMLQGPPTQAPQPTPQPTAGAMLRQGAGAMLQGAGAFGPGARQGSMGAATMQPGEAPQQPPGVRPTSLLPSSVSPETEASVNTMLRPPMNPVAAQYLAGTPMAGATTASEVPRLRAQAEAARNRIALLPTARERGDAMAPSLGLPTLDEIRAKGMRQPGYAESLEGRRLGGGGLRAGSPTARDLLGLDQTPASVPVPPEWKEEMSRRNEERLGVTPRMTGKYSPDRIRQDLLNRRLQDQSAWLNAPNMPTSPDTAALLASRSPTTGRTREQVKTERQGELAKRATRSEYRKTGVRVTPEMLTARTTLDSLGAPQTLEDALGQIALSARGYGGGGAVAPALAQLIPGLAMGNQANTKEQNEDARMGLAASIQAAGILDPVQRNAAFDRITAFEGRGKSSGRGGRGIVPGNAPRPGTETYPYDTMNGQKVWIPYKADADFTAALAKPEFANEPKAAAASLIGMYPQDVLDALVEAHEIQSTRYGRSASSGKGTWVDLNTIGGIMP